MRALLLLPMLLVGCNTIARGTDQTLAIRPDPADATCTVTQQGMAPISPVDGSVTLRRSSLPLSAECQKPGYQTERVMKLSMNKECPVGGVAYLVDASSGANYSYPPVVRVELLPIGQLRNAEAPTPALR